MKQLTLTSLNIIGKEALKNQFEAYLNMNVLKKKLFKSMGYTIEELTQEPYTLLFIIISQKFELPHNLASIEYEITTSLEELGAIQDTDYTITCKEKVEQENDL